MKRILISLLLTSVPGVGQTLHETTQWMHNFVAENGHQYAGQNKDTNGDCEIGTPNCEERHDVATFSSAGCSATITWAVTINYKDVGITVDTFSLRDLDPNSVSWAKDRPFNNAAYAATINSRKMVNEKSPQQSGGWLHQNTFVEIMFDNADDAKRFVKAFKHAVILCGGKPSTF